MIHDLQVYDIWADQNLGEPETKGVPATLNPSCSETALQDGQAETDTEVSLNVTSKPQHEQASPSVPETRIDSMQVLQCTMEMDTLEYLQFLERQAERGCRMLGCG